MIDIFTNNNLKFKNDDKKDILFYNNINANIFALRNYLRKNKVFFIENLKDLDLIKDFINQKAKELQLFPSSFKIDDDEFKKGILDIKILLDNTKIDKEYTND